MAPPPDILFVTIDQWRADSLGCAGHPVARTPHLDALAERGVRFARHYAQATPCGPSRASMLTGTYLHTHRSGLNGTPLDPRLTNVAIEARRAGYVPTLFGYTDTTVDPRTVSDPDDPRLRTYEGVLPGFEIEVNLPEHLGPWGDWLRSRGYDVPIDDVPAAMYRQHAADDGDAHDPPTVYRSEDSEAAFLVERYADWLGRQREDDALLAHLTFIRPHPPYMAPAPWNELIDPAAVPMPVRHDSLELESAQHPMIAGALLVEQAQAPEGDEEVRRLRATYWGMLAEVDHQFGQLIEALADHGRTDRTIVIVTADHGDELGDHHLVQKLGFFESSYHVPLIVAGPGVAAAGSVVDEFTEHVDLMPTVLTAIGAPVPPQCDGAPLQPFLAGVRPSTWRDAAHWEWDFRHPFAATQLDLPLAACNLAVLRDRAGKYVHFAGLPPAFYDLVDDPGELRNIAGEPHVSARLLDYAQRMLSWRMRHDDETLATYLVTDDGPEVHIDPPGTRA